LVFFWNFFWGWGILLRLRCFWTPFETFVMHL
jgi:hypothetical protein